MNILRYYHTLKHLKPIQIRYQLWYRIRRKIGILSGLPKPDSKDVVGSLLNFSNWIDKPISFSNQQFTFLNISHKFVNDNIHWNFNDYGKLWTYNLNYMDYLLQADISKDKGVGLIELFIKQFPANLVGKEPYSISLRGINWIKFISKHRIRNHDIDKSLYIQYQTLCNTLEFHLLGNHLLENGFSLLFGAFYFKVDKLYFKARQILEGELEEQILSDGGHFELSPMYHQIILDRLLDVINLLQNNQAFADQNQLLELITEKAGKMLCWLKIMTFQNGDIPHFNDSTYNIAPTTKQLLDYASRLNLPVRRSFREGGNQQLSTSGYRKFKGKNYECIVDVGHIEPSYIPGHAHADMLSFVVYADNKPFIIDMGISTYEKNNRRQLERSTSSHNTVSVNGENQSDVWGGFRVGKRAKINVIKDEKSVVKVEHNGYKSVIHRRIFSFSPDGLFLEDILSRKASAEAFLHFHPDRKVELNERVILVDNKYTIVFIGISNIRLEVFDYPIGYNNYLKAKKCIVAFNSKMQTKINIYEN